MTGDINGKAKTWLVKSSTRILGPFTLSEVTELLKTKQVSIIDEVRLPAGRWNYIRENKTFMEIVRNIREEQDSQSEKTMTQSVAYHTMTKTDPVTSKEEFTQTPVMGGANTPSIKDVTPLTETAGYRPATGGAKSYGASDDLRLQNKLRQKSNFLRSVMIGTAGIFAVAVVLFLSQKDQRKNANFDELMGQAIRYKDLGLYEKSLQAYQKAIKIKEPGPDIQVQMASVLISEDRQSLAGRRVLERALVKEGQSRGEIMDAYLGIAVSYMMDGDLKKAEDTLQRASGHEPFNLSVLLNLAIIQLKKGNYAEAMDNFGEIYRKNPHSVLALLGKALSTVEQAKSGLDSQLLHSLIQDIQDNIKKTAQLRQELLLMVVYAQNLLGDVDGVNQAVIQFLSQMPGRTKNYSHPLHVDWRFAQWDYLEKYCADVFDKSSPHPELKAFRAVCLMEVNRDAEAAKLLQEALVEAPQDPYVLVTQAGFLNRMARLPEAKMILKMPEVSSLSIKSLLLGDICINTQDVKCARQAFTEAYGRDNKSAGAMFGLAWVMMQAQDRAKAYNYIRAGLQSEPNYLPLLELRDQLEYQ